MAHLILGIVATYAGIGVMFGAAFVWIGAQRIDPAARGAPLGFRLLILPGASALWPLMAIRWAHATRAEHSHAN